MAVLCLTSLHPIIVNYSNRWLTSDWIYYLTSDGRKFKKLCDYVHEVADNVIKKRRQALVTIQFRQLC